MDYVAGCNGHILYLISMSNNSFKGIKVRIDAVNRVVLLQAKGD